MNKILTGRDLSELELLLNGAYNPLKGYMTKAEYKSVCETMHLPLGGVWSFPITLLLTEKEIEELEKSKQHEIKLLDETNIPLARLDVNDTWKFDWKYEARHICQTLDTNHPYVKYLKSKDGSYCVGGNITKINNVIHYDFREHRKSPEEVKKYFKNNGWKTIVGFQTRNPMHRSHYELTKYALRQTFDSEAKLFLNPVVGITQTVDVDYHIRVKCYKEMLKHYNNDEVLLNLLPLSMRMSGPREAVHHALIRKNYGCTHFVVGRDHAGPSFKKENGDSFYGPYDAQDLLMSVSDEIGIKVITSKFIVYNKTVEKYMAIDKVPKGEEVAHLSGTQLREYLNDGTPIPEWFSFPNIIKILQKNYKKDGMCFYFVGLSGSGKSTLANCFKTKLMELLNKKITLLDGDVVRQNLSKGLGFSKEDRSTNVKRIGYVASEIVKHGGIVLCANIAPYEEDRKVNRELISQYGKYIEIFVDTKLSICEERDVKGLYKLAREGIIKNFTGISDPFEIPKEAEIVIKNKNIKDSIKQIMDYWLEVSTTTSSCCALS